LVIASALYGCAQAPNSAPLSETPQAAAPAQVSNPFFAPWRSQFGAIPFDQIKLEHLAPALDSAMAEQLKAVDQITANTEPANFANTIAAIERAASSMRRVGSVYSVYTGNLSNDAVRALELEYSAKMAAHSNKIALNAALFARIQAVHAAAGVAGLSPEQARLTELALRRMVRAGAELNDAERAKVASLSEQESALMTRFNQNLLRDTEAFKLVLDEKDLSGLPSSVRAAAGQSGNDRSLPGKFVFTLQRPDYESFMAFSDRRDLREQYYRAFIARGDNGNEFDNKAIIAELVQLRAERSELLGFKNFAELATVDSMAKTPAAVLDLLERVWRPALAQTRKDADELQAQIERSGGKFKLAGWDWRYYGEQVRQRKFALDPAEVAPYFNLDGMLAASFAVTEKLFGLRFTERKDLPVYHPDVRVFEVKDQADQHVGLFYIDYFARQGKRSGAWMSNWRAQQRLDGEVTAHVVNNLNVPKPPAGEPALISITEAQTLFHELGHGLHGLLSNVTYPSLSGTSVPRDYVEFPAQFMEHYVLQPQVLKTYAKHAQTGASMPDALIERLLKAQQFNQGFATVEFVASALVDQRFHTLSFAQSRNLDVAKFERDAMQSLGALPQIPMRHRSPHFSHVFGGGYSAAYYAYMWSEVLDSDGFAAFLETGDIYHSATAKRLKEHVFSAGNSIDWMTGYKAFRGREPDVQALLKGRGLSSDGEG